MTCVCVCTYTFPLRPLDFTFKRNKKQQPKSSKVLLLLAQIYVFKKLTERRGREKRIEDVCTLFYYNIFTKTAKIFFSVNNRNSKKET